MKGNLLIVFTIFLAFSLHSQNFVEATKSSDGQKINLANDQVLEIKLPCNPSTGYAWYATSIDKSVIAQTGDWEFLPDENNGMVGHPGIEVLRFTGFSEGTSELTLEYKQPWEKNKQSGDIFKITIVSNGKYTGNYAPSIKTQSFKSYESDKSYKSSKSLLPASFNWQPYCTPIKNQGQCGACWSFAANGAFEAIINIIDGFKRKLSEQWLINCATGYSGCQGGWCPNQYFVSQGAVYEINLPYVNGTCFTTNGDTAKCIGKCGTYPHHEKADTSIYLNNGERIPPVDQIKLAVYNYGPVWCAVAAGPKHLSYSGGIFIKDEGTKINHGVVIVGWKDSTLSNGSSGYWILRNSWGTGWGEKGYMRIGYGVSGVGINANYIVYKGGIPCTGKPNPGKTITSANQVCPSEAFLLSLLDTISRSGALSYQWQSRIDKSAWTKITDANKASYVALQTVSKWYRCVVNCSGDTAISTPVQVSMIAPPICYCSATFYKCGCAYGIDITNVTFGNINNHTAPYCKYPDSYISYTGLSTTITQGKSYPISVTSDGLSLYNYPIFWGVWVDWNNSGSFTDNPNKYTVINNNSGKILTGKGTVSVPAEATLGNHRMRILANYNSDPELANVCGEFDWGEQEDYTVNVIPPPPCSGKPTPGNTLSSANPSCPSAAFTLYLQNLMGSGATYQWQSSKDNSLWTNIKGANKSKYDTLQTVPAYYRCKVICSSDTGTSIALKVTVMSIPVPKISQNGNKLVSNITTGNQWYDQNGIIAGAKSSYYIPAKNGAYYVIVTKSGCQSKPSNIINFSGAGINTINNDMSVNLYPNPNDGNFTVEINGVKGVSYILKIRNLSGEELLNEKLTTSAPKHIQSINLAKLSNGIYQMCLFNKNSEIKKVIVIQK